MKKTTYLFAAILAVCCMHAAGQPLVGQQPQTAFSMVFVPAMPPSLDFAGERVPLENYDTRESLERELMITAYMHSRTLSTLLNTTRYLPIIEPILARNGVPDDFKYLCMAESGLNPNVVSGAGAAGLWQLMPQVGKAAGLEVAPNLDERYHIEKATQVACNHLKESYARFGSWTMAAAAYNVGNAGLARRAALQSTGDYYEMFLPEETLRYVFRVLSWKMIAENPARYGMMIESAQYHKPLERYHTVEVEGSPIDWPEVARQHGTTYKMLRELNHWIRDYSWENPSKKCYRVKIPRDRFRDAVK